MTEEEERRRWLAEVDQIHADTQLKLRQRGTETWKVVVAAIGLTAIIVQAANIDWSELARTEETSR